MNREFLNIVLADHNEENQNVFKEIFKDLKIDVRVKSFHDGGDLLEHLKSDENPIPEVLFINREISGKSSIKCLEEIKTFRFCNMIIAFYSDDLSDDKTDEIFTKGGNICITKPAEYDSFKKILSEVITLNWQYHTSGLNKDNFILKI